jgi:hypothetical protein
LINHATAAGQRSQLRWPAAFFSRAAMTGYGDIQAPSRRSVLDAGFGSFV